MRVRRTLISLVTIAAVTALTGVLAPAGALAAPARSAPVHGVHLLVSGLSGSLGSTVGPDGALYVTESALGRVSRIDPQSGHRTTFATGLPLRIGDLGGAMDIAFLGDTAYVLVTLVSPDVGGADVDGIYRMDGPHHFSVVADIGAFSLAHPPVPPFFIPTGVQFAMQPYRNGFLVTDGHHNRILFVNLNGHIRQRIAFGDIVPTGLDVRGHDIYLAEAGPVPHLPQHGKVVLIAPGTHRAATVATGAPLVVDVEFAGNGKLFALSQGHFTPGNPEGSPADPNTGALERVTRDGTMVPVATGLDRPTSVELIGSRAYIVGLGGDVVVVDHIFRH
jgi:DNA-binding beta-propeller fold protein YncE